MKAKLPLSSPWPIVKMLLYYLLLLSPHAACTMLKVYHVGCWPTSSNSRRLFSLRTCVGCRTSLSLHGQLLINGTLSGAQDRRMARMADVCLAFSTWSTCRIEALPFPNVNAMLFQWPKFYGSIGYKQQIIGRMFITSCLLSLPLAVVQGHLQGSLLPLTEYCESRCGQMSSHSLPRRMALSCGQLVPRGQRHVRVYTHITFNFAGTGEILYRVPELPIHGL